MADVTCDRCTELLGDYVEGRLAQEVLGAVEGHVASCAACAALVRDYQAIPGLVRGATDVEAELELECLNRSLAPEVETVFVPARAELAEVSSSRLKALAAEGRDISTYCPPEVAARLRRRLAEATSREASHV